MRLNKEPSAIQENFRTIEHPSLPESIIPPSPKRSFSVFPRRKS